jgi:hypothetical protein
MDDTAIQEMVVRKLALHGRDVGWYNGWHEGWLKGRLEQARRMLLLIGEKIFGPPDAEQVAKINAINSLERLRGMGEMLIPPESWEQLIRMSDLDWPSF